MQDAARIAADSGNGSTDHRHTPGHAEPTDEPTPSTLIPSVTQPLVDAAMQALRERTAHVSNRLSPEAWADLRLALSGAVAGQLARWIHREFQRHLVDISPDEERDPESTQLWDSWVADLRRQGLLPLWSTYPVLARLVGSLLADWVDRIQEFLQRLDADHAAIAELQGLDELGPATGIDSGLADPHLGHRPILICHFGQQAVVYKAKDVATEALLSALLDWVRDMGADAGAGLRVVVRDDYGWVEFAQHLPAHDLEDVRRFYTRAGALTCLMFAIGGSDLHFENVVASCDRPTIIDAETALQPRVAHEDDPRLANGQPDPGAVLRQHRPLMTDSLMLPHWRGAGRQPPTDISALGAASDRLPKMIVTTWQNPETDAAYLVRGPQGEPVKTNQLHLASGPLVRSWDHADEIDLGIRIMWDTLVTHRDELVSPTGPLAQLAKAQTRVLMRPTMSYARLREASTRADLLASGVDYSIHLEHLGRHMLDNPDPRAAFALARQERDQMENGDVPFFATTGSEECLRGEDGTPAIWFRSSPLRTATDRLNLLTDSEMAVQLNVVHSTLQLANVPSHSTALSTHAATGSETPNDALPTDVESAAEQLLSRLMAGSRTELGWASWPGIGVVDHSHYAVERGNGSMFSGNLGIALALSAAGRILNNEDAGKLADQALAPLLDAIDKRPRRVAVGLGNGASEGLGGNLFGLTTLAALRPQSHTLEAAQALVENLTAADIDRDKDADLLSGLTGLLAGLITFEDAGGQGCSELIDRTTRRVLSLARTSPDGSLVWPQAVAPDGMWGYAHGNAGKAAVLSAVIAHGHVIDGAQNAVVAAVRTESAAYNESLGGWPDERSAGGGDHESPRQPVLGPGWCNGAAGIALSRTVIRSFTPDAEQPIVNQDLDRSLATLMAGTNTDKLCCGLAGKAEVLRYARHHLPGIESDRVVNDYESAISGIAARTADGTLDLRIPVGLPLTSFGLYHGIAGVLWGLLGYLDPHLPNLNSWLPEPRNGRS